MATKHTAIINQVLVDWTEQRRGTLWKNPQIRVPLGNDGGWTRAGLGDGTADIVGIENVKITVFGKPLHPGNPRPIEYQEECGLFAAIEVKTRTDWLKKRQKDFLSVVNDWNARYYLALELPGCTVEKPLYGLYRVHDPADLARVRREWNEVWKKYEGGELDEIAGIEFRA